MKGSTGTGTDTIVNFKKERWQKMSKNKKSEFGSRQKKRNQMVNKCSQCASCSKGFCNLHRNWCSSIVECKQIVKTD